MKLQELLKEIEATLNTIPNQMGYSMKTYDLVKEVKKHIKKLDEIEEKEGINDVVPAIMEFIKADDYVRSNYIEIYERAWDNV